MFTARAVRSPPKARRSNPKKSHAPEQSLTFFAHSSHHAQQKCRSDTNTSSYERHRGVEQEVRYDWRKHNRQCHREQLDDAVGVLHDHRRHNAPDGARKHDAEREERVAVFGVCFDSEDRRFGDECGDSTRHTPWKTQHLRFHCNHAPSRRSRTGWTNSQAGSFAQKGWPVH